MPSINIIELYKNLGGEIITIGSDAHTKQDVGAGIDQAEDLLKTIGFNHAAIYRERKPHFYRI
jgi:histidinol-phosphatase (PHP family)